MIIAKRCQYIYFIIHLIYNQQNMKKNFILLPLLGVLAYAALTSYTSGPAVSGGLERTGASGSAVGCGGGGCHSTGPTTTVPSTVTLASGTTPVMTYTPGASYNVVLTCTNTATTGSLPKFGFQVAAMKSGSTTVNAGVWGALPALTHTVTASGINLVEHSSQMAPFSGTGSTGTIYAVSIPWTAPAAGTGSVKLFGVVNAVNNNFNADNNDKWDTTYVVITEAASTGVAAIAGTFTVCAGATTTLTDATTGGTWSSSTPTVGTIGSATGIVTGIAAGTTTITYNAGTTGTATAVVTVSAAGAAPIVGATHVCLGSSPTTTLTDATTGGTWTSSTVAKATIGSTTGLVTGVAAGTTTISYTASNACGTATATKIMTVYAVGACPLAVNNISNMPSTGLSVYPNPNNGSFTLLMQSDNIEEAHVVICGISGEKVKEFITNTNTTVDMKLPRVTGMYFISVTTSQGNYVSRLLIQ
jgi:uncharacterized protein YjdB